MIIIINKMLSEEQIQKLKERLQQLKNELNILIDEFGIGSENTIDQELEEFLKEKTPNEDLQVLIKGFRQAQENRNVAQLMETWINTKQVDKVKHRNHEELKQVGVVFSPRNSSYKTPQPVDHGQLFRNDEENEVEEPQDAMQVAEPKKPFQGESADQLLNNPKITRKNAGEEVKAATQLLVRKNISDEKLPPHQTKNSQNIKTVTSQEIEVQAEQNYSVFNDLCLKKENLQRVLKYKREPKVESIESTLEDKEDDDPALEDTKLYRDLIRDLPLYKAFLQEKPKLLLETSHQVLQALSQSLSLEDQLELLSEILDLGKDILYYQGLQKLDSLVNTKQYQQLKVSMDGFVFQQDWESINIKLISSFVKDDPSFKDIILKHSIMHYFMQLKQEQNNLLENPISILALIKDISSIIEEENDRWAKNQLQQLQNQFKEGQITIAMQACDELQPKQQKKIYLLFQNHQLRRFSQHLQVKQKISEQIKELNIHQDFKKSQFYNSIMGIIDGSFEMTAIHKSFINLLQKQDSQFKQQNLLSIISLFSVLHRHEIFMLSPYEIICQFTENQATMKIVEEILDQLQFDQPVQRQQNNDVIQEQKISSQNSLSSLFDSLQEKDQSFFLVFSSFIENFPQINFSKAQQIIKQQLSIEEKLRKVLSWDDLIIDSKHSYLFQVNDFMSLNIETEYNELQEKICTLFQQGQKIQKEKLVHLLFESIKKRMTFESFIENLYINYDSSLVQLTQMNLMCYLLDNCNSELRTMLLLACSTYMPVPLIANRPYQNQINEQLDQSFEHEEQEYLEEEKIIKIPEGQKLHKKELPTYFPKVYEEILFSFEKYKGVLAFKVNSDKDSRSLIGCTTLTNRVLNRQFELHSPLAPIANYGQVEVQFDYNFSEAKFLTVAEVHGHLNDTELFTLMSQFNIFIIHCFADDQAEVNKYIDRINLKSNLVLVVMQDESAKQSFFSEKIIQKGLIQFNISNMINLQRNHMNSLSTNIKDRIIQSTTDWKNYQQNIEQRIHVLQEFAEFCISFNSIHNWNQFQKYEKQEILDDNQLKQNTILQKQDQQDSLVDTVQLIKQLMENILAHKNLLKDQKVLPFNEIYSCICENEDQIKRENLDPSTIQQKRILIEKQLDEIQQKTKQSGLSIQIFNILCEQNSFVGLVFVLSKLIKSLLYTALDPLIIEREKIEELVSQSKDIEFKNKKIEEIENLSQQIQKKQFSIEFFFREFYIQENVFEKRRLNDPQTIHKPYERYLQIAKLQIQNGQPFEIIDGDNLRFIHGVYQLMQNQYQSQDQILVVSVIGPQSSGKSLLLNSLFGTQFQTSSGRCTKGVYGCLIDVEPQDGCSCYKKILILDTEGIQSTEKKDTGFDNRIIFYILCVSHLVFVCNKGEINRDMQELLKIAVYSISQFKGLVQSMPQVNIIMNQNSQIDDRNLHQTYQNLQQSLIEIGMETDDSHLMLNIKKENVFFLPMAFSLQGSFDDLQANKTSIKFAQSAEKLKQNIFNFMKQANQQSMKQYTLKQFFEYAQKTWVTVNNYHEIDKYSSLEQIKQASKLSRFINDLIVDSFQQQDQKDKIKFKIEQTADQEFSKHKDSDHSISTVLLSQKIEEILQEYKRQIKVSLQSKFDDFCKKEKIENQVVRIYLDIFYRMIDTNFLEWQSIVNNKVQKYVQEKSRKRGNQLLQNVIENEIMKSGIVYDDQQANSIFDLQWQKVLVARMSELKDVDTITKETFENAYHYQRSQIKDFQTREQDLDMLRIFQEQQYNIQSLQNQLEIKQSQDFFYFTGHKKCRYQYEDIGKFISKQRYYKYVKQREVYNWKQVVIERFDFKKLQEEINKIFAKKQFIIDAFEKIFASVDSKINKLVEQINKEGQIFFVGTTYQFDQVLQKIAQYYNDHDKNDQLRFLGNQIKLIKNNLEDYFEYVWHPPQNQQDYRNNIYFYKSKLLNFQTSQIKKNHEYHQVEYTSEEQIFNSKDTFKQLKRGEVEIKNQNELLTVNREIIDDDDRDLIYYLNQIQKDDCDLRPNEDASLSARKYFFKMLNKKYILSEIQRIVIENVYNKQDDPSNIKDFQKLMKFLSQQKDPEITSQFCQMDMRLFQRVAPQIELLVSKINKEVEIFRLNVFETGIFSLHQIAQTLITCIYIEIRRINEHSSHFNVEKMMETERRLFVSKITFKDQGQDKNLAEKAANHLFKIVKEKAKQIHQEKFYHEIIQHREFFNVKQIIINIEKYILKVGNEFEEAKSKDNKKQELNQLQQLQEESKEEQNAANNIFSKLIIEKYCDVIDDEYLKDRNITWQQIIQMYVEPDIFFKDCFTQSWKNKTQEVIKKLQTSYKNYKIQILSDLISYFKLLKELMNKKQLNFAANIFYPQIQQLKGKDEKKYQQICKKAFSFYLRKLIRRKWDNNYKMKIDGLNVAVNPSISLIHHNELIEYKIDQDYSIALSKQLKNEMISSFQIFVDSLISCFEKEKAEDLFLEEKVIIQDLEHQMRQESTGCYELCPLCRRKCDKIHQERQDLRIHGCQATGHQIIGFGGSFHAKINCAITFGCHELEDGDLVQHEGDSKQWRIYKRLFRQWDFQDNYQKNYKQHKKDNMKIWNSIGPIICQEYQKKYENCKIKFIEADNDAKMVGMNQKIMYILVLDSSGSMEGTKWRNVLTESKRFLSTLQIDYYLKKNSKISIITYSSEASIVIENQEPNPQLTQSVQFIGGDTDFQKPLMLVKDLATKYLKQFDAFHVCFLSDGQAPYPSEAIKQIKENNELQSKFKMTTVYFSGSFWENILKLFSARKERSEKSDSPGLKQLADEFGGRFCDALTPEDFSNSLLEMIPNIYRKPDA